MDLQGYTPWTGYPSAIQDLEAGVRTRIERAVFWAICGQIDLCDRTIADLEDAKSCTIFHLEHANILRRRGDVSAQMKCLATANESTELCANNEIMIHTVNLLLSEVIFRCEGRLHQALTRARETRRLLSSSSVEHSMGDFQVQCIITYYDIMEQCHQYSNWASTDQLSIFEETEARCGEPALIARTLQKKGRFRESLGMWITAHDLEDDYNRKEELKRCTHLLLDSIPTSGSPMNTFLAGRLRLQYASILYEQDDVPAAREQILSSMNLLDSLNNNLALLLSIHQKAPKDLEDPALSFDSWKTLAPQVFFDFQVTMERCQSVPRTQISAERLLLFADKMKQRGQKAKQRVFLRQAVTAAQAAHTISSTPSSLTAVRGLELEYLAFESTKPQEALFLAIAILRVLSIDTHNLLSWDETLERCEDFLRAHEGFDVPGLLYRIKELAMQCAIRVGLRDSARKYQEATKNLRKWQPFLEKGEGRKLQVTAKALTHEIYFMEEIHPLVRGQINWMQMFQGCIKTMLRWLETEQDHQALLSQLYDSDGSAIKGNDHVFDLDAIVASMPRMREQIGSTLGWEAESPTKFELSTDENWMAWFCPVEKWLLSEEKPPLAVQKQYVLKVLATVRTYYATQACTRLDGELPSFDIVKDRAKAERTRFRIYSTVLPSVLGPNDMRMARSALISITLTLSFFPQAKIDGSVNDIHMKEACDLADALADEYDKLNKWSFQYEMLCSGGRLRWRRYNVFHTTSWKETLSPLEKAENIALMIREQQSTVILSSRDTYSKPHLEFAGRTAASKREDLSSHISIALVAAIEGCTLSPTNLDMQSKEQLCHWVQRSKARSIVQLMKYQLPVPERAFQGIQSSSKASTLVEEEATLAKSFLATDTRFERKTTIRQQLHDCRQKMRAEPALRDLLSAREASPPDLRQIQAMLLKLQNRGQEFVFVDMFHAASRRCDSDIAMLIHRAGQPPELRAAGDVTLSSVETWWKEMMKRSRPLGTPLKVASNTDTDAIATARKLCRISAIIAPLEEMSRRGDTIVFCPTKALHGFPLHVLLLADEPLIKRNPVSYCQSFAQLELCLESSESSSSFFKPALLYGLTQDSGKDVEPARRSALQAATLETLWQTRLIKDELLDRRSVLDALEGASLIHWHGHADFDEEYPINSGLILADTKPLPSKKTLEKRVTAQDFFSIRFRKPALAIILGCQSGEAEAENGGDLIGLNSSLHHAGASAVISAKWKIDDLDAAKYSEAFFDAIREQLMELEQNKVVGEQLHASDFIDLALVNQKALIELMKSSGDDSENQVEILRAPYHWAAFTLNGSWFYPRVCYPKTN